MHRKDNANKLETDTFEVSWHSGHRPSHWWGGQWFVMEQLISICGLGQPDGLCGCNCYHSYSPVVPGVSVPTYTKEQLEQMEAEENKKIEYNGKEYTKYEALQRQRKLETRMRAQRQDIKLLQEGEGDEFDLISARAKYRTTSTEYVNFSKAMGLPQQRERVTVDKLRNIGNITKKQQELIELGLDVTKDYKDKATPGLGEIIFDDNYNLSLHKEEVAFARWLHNYYGGRISLLNEVNENKVRTPDYLWKHKLWDLKNTTTEKAANSAIRKGLKQIIEKPGGIILNFGDVEFSMESLQEVIRKRMKWHKGYTVDIMIVAKNEVIKILRFYK